MLLLKSVLLNARPVCVVLLSISVASALFAHDLYLLPGLFHVSKGKKLKVAFHNGDAFPESEVAPKIDRLLEAQVSGKSGSAPMENLHIAGKETFGEVKIPGTGTFLVSVRTVPNFIELAPDKFLEYLKEEGLAEVIDWRTQHAESGKPGRERYTKFAKSLIRSGTPDDYFQHSLGFPIEIIPLSDPSFIRAGGSLPVRVMFRGKPAAGLQIESAWALGTQKKTVIVGRTGADGSIVVPIAQEGKWRLHTLKMERCAEPAVADWESSWASLTFEIQ